MSAAGDQCRKPQRENHTRCFWGHALLSTFASTCWITFHIKPLRFHCSLLCVSPTEFVARAMSRYCPRSLGVQDVRQRRHEYFPISEAIRASAQVAPPSVDTSTRLIRGPESNAPPSIYT